jgi:hypothetical protein
VCQDMSMGTELRRRVLTGELSRTGGARREHEIHWDTPKRIFTHPSAAGLSADAATLSFRGRLRIEPPKNPEKLSG